MAHNHNHHDHSAHGSSGHGHSHSTASGHSHAPAVFDKAFAVGISLNLGFVFIEFFYGFISNSLALMADAGHNLSDVLSLALAWAATWLARRKPSKARTYGFGRSSILASLINAFLLLIAIGAIGWEAIIRFSNPVPIESGTVIWVAALGILINSATAFMFMRGKDGDINIKGAYLHMVADAAVSLGVVIAAVVLGYTGWLWIDPMISLVIVVVIAVGTFSLLKESADMALDAVPRSIDLEKVEEHLKSIPGVTAIHDLHVLPLSTTSIALTAHLVKPDGETNDKWLHEIAEGLHEEFGIDHPTIQIERGGNDEECKLAPDTVI